VPKILKLLIAFGALALLCVLWLASCGFQMWLRSELNKQAIQFPGLKLTPIPLANTLVSPDSGNEAGCNGYVLDLPWPEKSLPSGEPNRRGACVFSNGQNMVMMYVGAPNEEINRFYGAPSMRPLLEQKYFGADPPRTNYEFVKRVLGVTPNTFPRYGGWMTLERDAKLFEQKKLIVRDTGADDVIYSVSTPSFQGFQFSSPSAKASVEVRLYSDKNKVTLQFLTTGKGKPLPQQDINAVVQSVKRDPRALMVEGGKN
jgi:hypothetical protein